MNDLLLQPCKTGCLEQGKMTGPKPPLRPGHVWLIRAKPQLERRTRDLALFNLAIDSKLRGCDLVALRVDVAPNGYAVDRANIRQVQCSKRQYAGYRPRTPQIATGSSPLPECGAVRRCLPISSASARGWTEIAGVKAVHPGRRPRSDLAQSDWSCKQV
jgi:hypothetical protein